MVHRRLEEGERCVFEKWKEEVCMKERMKDLLREQMNNDCFKKE